MSEKTPASPAAPASSTSGKSGAGRRGDEAGAVYSLGYERYQGPRRDRSTRFWIISRTVIRQAWKSTWGVKLPLGLASMVVVGGAVAMWLLRHELVDMVRQVTSGAPPLPALPLLAGMFDVVDALLAALGMGPLDYELVHRVREAAPGASPIPGPEAALYMSVGVFSFLAFVLTTTVGCRAIADDLRMGSFQFYFSRPLRVSDYVTGKLIGVLVVVGMPMLGGPVLLGLVRLLFARGAADAWAHADVLPRAVAVGLVGTLAYGIVGLALGALLGRRVWAQGGFAIYYLVFSNLIELAALKAGEPLLAVASIDANLTSLGVALFGAPEPPGALLPPAWAAAGFTAVLVGLGLWVIDWRIRHAETAALGGSS
jgi:hypothetical protein